MNNDPADIDSEAYSIMYGDKNYNFLAQKALPILVRQANAEQPLFYSDLAHELDMSNARNLNYVLGTIGNALQELSEEWDEEVPPIQCLVINKQTGFPGEGISWFVPDAKEFKKASSSKKRRTVKIMLESVIAYQDWDEVLNFFDLKPATRKMPSPGHKTDIIRYGKYGKGGESKEHKRLKDYVASNPQIVGLSASVGKGETEFCFQSLDSVDILFKDGNKWIGIEVKSKRSGVEDIIRGIFQCVKYSALIEASQKIDQINPDSRVVLLLQDSFPLELLDLINVLGIEVIDGVESLKK